MKFSIVIPLFNKEKSIRRALYSVFDQNNMSEHDVEILVVNDGSTDASVEQVIKIACEQSHRHLTLINQQNAGVSAARNRGASLATHPIVCFLDADDTYKPNFLSELRELVRRHPECRFFATAYNFVNTNSGTVTKAQLRGIHSDTTSQLLPNFFDSAVRGDLPFCASSFGIKRSLFTEINGFPEGENMGEDQELYVKVALNHKIAYNPKACANYYVDVTGSLMNTEKAHTEMPYSKRLQSQLDEGKVPSAFEQSAIHYIARHLTDLARRNLISGNTQAAKNLLNDNRTKAKPLKWLYWYGRYLINIAIEARS